MQIIYSEALYICTWIGEIMTDLKVTSKIQQNQYNKKNGVNQTRPINTNSGSDTVSFNNNKKKLNPKSIFKRVQLAIASFLLAFNTGSVTTKAQTTNQAKTSIEQQVQNEDNYTRAVANNTTLEDELENHIHAATVITTPHETVRYIYVPKGGTGDGNNDISVIADDETLADITNGNFANINDDNIYPIALDQAKAN